jgi:hypothetical protein
MLGAASTGIFFSVATTSLPILASAALEPVEESSARPAFDYFSVDHPGWRQARRQPGFSFSISNAYAHRCRVQPGQSEIRSMKSLSSMIV